MIMALQNMNEIRAAAAKGMSHWFSAGSMAFFGTRLFESSVKPTKSGALFITSEQPPHGARMYSVRRAYDSGVIETVGTFCGHVTYEEAGAALNEELELQE
jgi:hypothetical protein